MKTTIRWMLVFVMLMLAAPALAVDAVQMFKCEMEDDATEDEVRAIAKEWLAAARKTKGGEQLGVSLYFPIAVNVTGQTDFLFMVHTPSVEQWGVFWDGYKDSPVSKVDAGIGSKVVCPDSALWEVNKIELKP
jgi:hypothetical protein